MKRVIIYLLLALTALYSCSPRRNYVLLTGSAQGGTYQIKFCTDSAQLSPGQLKSGIDSLLAEIDLSLSGYNPNSLLSRFNAGEQLSLDEHFVTMYCQARRIWRLTGGAVDVAAGPLFDLWGFGFKEGKEPSDSLARAVAASCGMALLPDSPDSLLAFRPEGTVLNFNCMAQGYSCDVLAAYLRENGVRDMLINVGGEIYCEGLNPASEAWTVGIDKPVDGNFTPGAQLQGVFRAPAGPCGIVTSGNYRKYYIKDGKKYAHTVDPRTALPVSHSLLSATVVAPDATQADAFATYCMVIGLEEARDFILNNPSLEACLVYDEDGRTEVWCSPAFVLTSN